VDNCLHNRDSNIHSSLITTESSAAGGMSSFEYARSFDSFSQTAHTPITQFRAAANEEDRFQSPIMSSNSTSGILVPSTTLFSPKSVPELPIVYPWDTLGVIVLVWSVYVALMVTNTIFGQCSLGSAATLIAVYPPLVAGSVYGVYKAAAEQKNSPVTVLIGDLKFDDFDLKPTIFVFIVGILSSLLGIGGGELVGPLLLYLGVIPQVSSATTSILGFFNTFSILIREGAQADIDFQIGGILVAIGFCAGLLGRSCGLWFAETYKRPSILIFCLVAILLLSCIFYIYSLSAEPFETGIADLCRH
jgi:hypothetical protein